VVSRQYLLLLLWLSLACSHHNYLFDNAGEGCTDPEESSVSSSTPSLQLACTSTASRIVGWCRGDRKRKREEEPTYSTISERIRGIVDHLGKLRSSVREVLQLEISRPITTENQSQCVAKNTRVTSSIPIEDKVYGRDAETDRIVELLINGKSSDLQVLPIVGIGGIGTRLRWDKIVELLINGKNTRLRCVHSTTSKNMQSMVQICAQQNTSLLMICVLFNEFFNK
jgi:hypothetical protein